MELWVRGGSLAHWFADKAKAYLMYYNLVQPNRAS